LHDSILSQYFIFFAQLVFNRDVYLQREREQEDGLVSAYNEAGFNLNHETEDMPSSQVASVCVCLCVYLCVRVCVCVHVSAYVCVCM
jgi:hypothetical protein